MQINKYPQNIKEKESTSLYNILLSVGCYSAFAETVNLG